MADWKQAYELQAEALREAIAVLEQALARAEEMAAEGGAKPVDD